MSLRWYLTPNLFLIVFVQREFLARFRNYHFRFHILSKVYFVDLFAELRYGSALNVATRRSRERRGANERARHHFFMRSFSRLLTPGTCSAYRFIPVVFQPDWFYGWEINSLCTQVIGTHTANSRNCSSDYFVSLAAAEAGDILKTFLCLCFSPIPFL